MGETVQDEQAAVDQGGAGGALESILADAALGTVHQWFPGTAGLRTAARLATRPRTVARRGLGLTKDLAVIAAGRSRLKPAPKDRRFSDPAWTGNPLLRRLVQSYLVSAQALDHLVDDAELDWRDERRMRYLVDQVTAALAPSNAPFVNPAALKAALDTGGMNYVRGAGQLVRELARKPHIPAMVDESAFAVGRDLAITPGQVVLRTPLIELIQYRPRTEQVREHPVLMVPPMINKYYVADLAPGRSMIEHQLDNGLQVFTISWRNPGAEESDWGIDEYVGAVIDALDAVESITGSPTTNLIGICAGGITASITAGHLAATGRLERVRSLTCAVTVLDQEQAGTLGSIIDPQVAALAASESARKGYLDGKALAGVFAWLRPNDLVWNYWVNNYLLGKRPPAFDVLYWNGDSTRMPAKLHRDFLDMTVHNRLVDGSLRVRGTRIDLSKVTVDTYNLAGIADHICPWENVYRSARLFGSTPRFILSTSGHIAALVNPPTNPKATWQTNDESPDDPEIWLKGATTHRGSWWTDWAAWANERSGELVAAPQQLGDGDHAPIVAAPGTYVLER